MVKARRQTSRRPATKYAQLQKKMQKQAQGKRRKKVKKKK